MALDRCRTLQCVHKEKVAVAGMLMVDAEPTFGDAIEGMGQLFRAHSESLR